MMISTFCHPDEIKVFALNKGFALRDEQPKSHLTIFVKGNVQINVWNGRRRLTVATVVTHPHKGRNTLYRRRISNEDLMWIFRNPRAHLNKGYR